MKNWTTQRMIFETKINLYKGILHLWEKITEGRESHVTVQNAELWLD